MNIKVPSVNLSIIKKLSRTNVLHPTFSLALGGSLPCIYWEHVRTHGVFSEGKGGGHYIGEGVKCGPYYYVFFPTFNIFEDPMVC